MKRIYFHLLCVLTFSLLLSSSAAARDAVSPGEFVVEPPTLLCLGFEWPINGDENRNATVEVTYRKKGEKAWHDALPLLRIGGEKISDMLSYSTPHLFAGSIFDLQADTEYECSFVMKDPDGISGNAEKKVTVKTRSVPQPYSGGKTYHVYPPGFKGDKKEPAYTGVKQAYFGPGGDDWGLAAHPQIEPGDIILVHAGLYRADRMDYVHPIGLTFHGTYVLTKSGTPEKPIVIKAAGDGEVIFDGDGSYRLFDVMGADNIHFEGLTIRNTEIAFYAGVKMVKGSSGLVVKNCRFLDVGIGVFTESEDSKNFYIADNVMIGREDSTRVHGWNRRIWAKYGKLADVSSFVGVKVYGQGHVICHNYIAYFHDGIDVNMHGSPEKEQSKKCVAIDIYNNDIFMSTDDCIEADGGEHNIRVFRNRGFNVAHHGISAQPIYGGPAYFIRNVICHAYQGGAMKLNNHPSGLIIYHNTFITEWQSGYQPYSNVHLRNNLFLGTDHPDRPILRAGTFTSYSSFDYNGYRPNKGQDLQFMWKAPSDGQLQDYSKAFQNLRRKGFKTLEEFSTASGQEKHGVIVDYDILMKAQKPDPSNPGQVYYPGDYDLRLRKDASAIDAGVNLANINEGYSGKAPDLGANEYGKTPTHYGPR